MHATPSPFVRVRGSSSPVLWAAAIMGALVLLLTLGGGLFWTKSVHMTSVVTPPPSPVAVLGQPTATVPAGLPAWVPVPKPAEWITRVESPSDAAPAAPAAPPAASAAPGAGSFTFSSSQTPEEMAAFYKEKLAAAGLVLDTENTAPGGAMLHASDAASGRSVGIVITPAPGGTGSVVVITPVEKTGR